MLGFWPLGEANCIVLIFGWGGVVCELQGGAREREGGRGAYFDVVPRVEDGLQRRSEFRHEETRLLFADRTVGLLDLE